MTKSQEVIIGSPAVVTFVKRAAVTGKGNVEGFWGWGGRVVGNDLCLHLSGGKQLFTS
jgi:hypothetical protein